MITSVLAEQLKNLAEAEDAGAFLAVETVTGKELFRFVREGGDGKRCLSWEASLSGPSSEAAMDESHADWLRRSEFSLDGGRFIRWVALPSTLGAGRLIADLAVFLLEKVYDMPSVQLSRSRAGIRRRL